VEQTRALELDARKIEPAQIQIAKIGASQGLAAPRATNDVLG
jgi:hypothetical protein